MFLRPLCFLSSVIVKTALWLRQVLRNLSTMFSFPSLLEQVYQYRSAVSSGLQWLSTTELTLQVENMRWKRWGILWVHWASLTVATIKSIVSCCVVVLYSNSTSTTYFCRLLVWRKAEVLGFWLFNWKNSLTTHEKSRGNFLKQNPLSDQQQNICFHNKGMWLMTEEVGTETGGI